MIRRGEISEMGNDLSVHLGKVLVEGMKKEGFKESAIFKEDNTMGNSGDLYTIALAKAIYYKSYDAFQQYFDLAWNLTPADLGMPEGAGSYKIPKIQGSTAVKLADGEVVDYINDNKTSVSLDTETYGIGTRITRRLILRGAKGFVDKLITAASDAVLRAVAQDLINGMVAGSADANKVTGGITYSAIELAKKNIVSATSSEGVLFGFEADTIAFSSVGWYTLAISADFKALVQYGQRNVPGDKTENMYQIFNGLKVVMTPLISVQYDSKAVHALVIDSKNYAVFLRETEMETFDGRIPGTAGDKEIILAMDAGSAILNSEAGAVITA